MSEWLQIRLSTGPQQFETELGSVPVTLSILWRDGDGAGWFLDIDGDGGKAYVHGVPLLVGKNLLEGLEFLGLGELWVFADGFDDCRISFEDLGTKVDKVFWRA